MRHGPTNLLTIKKYLHQGRESLNVSAVLIDAGTDALYSYDGWFENHPDGCWRLGWWQEILIWGKPSRLENLHRLCTANRVYGRPYQGSMAVKERLTQRVEHALHDLTEVLDILELGVLLSKTITEAIGQIEQPSLARHRRIIMDKNETKQTTKVETPTAQCAVAPKDGAKNSARCPYRAASGSDICKLHQSLEKRYHVRMRRVGEATPAAEPVKQDAITSAAPAAPEVQAGAALAPKLTKKQKVQQALAILSAKQAAKNDAAVDTGMVQRSLPDAK